MSRTRSAPRVYFAGSVPAHGACTMPPEQAHHVVHVLRLGAGDALILFDGRGVEYDARIERVSKTSVSITIGERRAVDRESPLEVTLAQGISSGERMDYTIQKVVELGVGAIQPLATERSIVRLSAERAEKRLAHWRAVAIAACEQCGRNRVPPVLPVTAIGSWLAGQRDSTALRLTLSPQADVALKALAPPDRPVVLLAGPEGGLAPREQDDARAAGFAAVRLGPRVLRTETAAVAALAAMQVLWGDF